ncbi:MAG: ribosome maturation factor RimP [Gemmatimonadetes bacterium]|jgi:ribosome maturation factor RimP|nr:ribosome maturation factor RimP [Gemmatimonadota bacterium]
MRAVADVERGIEIKVADLGFELVELRWAGSSRRPVLQLRVDRPAEAAEEGVNVDDCARISRELEPWLDEHGGLSEHYVLEVSSPGVDRPLVRSTDFERFRGKRIAVVGKRVLLARSTRLEGELLGLDKSLDGAEAVRLCLPDGDEVVIPRSEIRKAHLVFTWK